MAGSPPRSFQQLPRQFPNAMPKAENAGAISNKPVSSSHTLRNWMCPQLDVTLSAVCVRACVTSSPVHPARGCHPCIQAVRERLPPIDFKNLQKPPLTRPKGLTPPYGPQTGATLANCSAIFFLRSFKSTTYIAPDMEHLDCALMSSRLSIIQPMTPLEICVRQPFVR